ncbi:hypothetical protein JCM18750_22010 [Halostagnicola bangensis]
MLGVGLVLCGLLVGLGAGVAVGAADSDTSADFEALNEGKESQTTVSLVESTIDASDPSDDDVVVHYGDNFVVSGAYADGTPPEPAVTVDGDPLVVREGVVQTRDGREDVEVDYGDETEPVEQVSGSPDIAVGGTNLEISDDGTVRTADEEANFVGVGDDPAEYDNFDEEILQIEFESIDDITEGEELSVNVTFTNYGYERVEKTAKLSGVDSNGEFEEGIDSWKDVELDGGEQTTKSFVDETDIGYGDMNELQLELDGEREADTAIDVKEAELSIVSFDANTPVEGEDLSLSGEIERIGSVPFDELTATVSINGQEVKHETFDLDPGESESVGYETNNSSHENGEATIETAYVPESSESDGDVITNEDEVEITIISRQDHNESMSATILNTSVGNLSEELEVNASIDYDGDVPDGETVVPTTFLVDGSVANETNVTVEDGSPTDVTFATELDEDTVPVTSVTVETPGRSDTVEFARAVTTDVSVNDPFASNESLEAVVEIENDGDTPEMVNLTVSVDDPASVESDGSESRELSVNASETVEAEFTFEPTDHASSQIEVTAEAGDSSDTATTNRPVFEVEDVELEGADDAGSGLTMSGNVTNTGEIPDTQTIQFTLDGELVTEKNVTLDPDESETVSADIEPPEEDGEYGFGMTANNETATAGESAEGSAEINVSGTSLLDRLSSLALPLLLLGLLVIGVVALKYRDDPQAFKRRIATAQSTVQSAVQGIVGGGGSVIVENGLPRDSTVRIQVKDANGVVFQEDLQLADGEQREFPSLPDDGQFEVGVGVDDVASHSEVFQGPTDSVGVVLQPDGITIAEL